MTIWKSTNGINSITSTKSNTYRIVEDQSKSTTRKFVDTALEHELLEKLLDESKPSIKYYDDEKDFHHLHYLLYTPFRYPPLKWGSRFGTRWERGLLYTSDNLNTAMCEKAFYKLAFLNASDGNIGGKTLPCTVFKVALNSKRFVDLCTVPFASFINQISDKQSYRFSQPLGTAMRTDNIECFQYASARTSDGNNFGVFTPKALGKNAQLEKSFVYYNCYATKEVVEFTPKHSTHAANHVFDIEQFLVKGKLPLPPS